MRARSSLSGFVALPVLLIGCADVPDGAEDTAGLLGDDVVLERATQTVSTAFEDERPVAWFVEMEQAPLVRGGVLSMLDAEKATFRKAAKQSGIRYRERRVFQRLWNGFSVDADERDLHKIVVMPGVKAIYPVYQVHQDAVAGMSGGSPASLVNAVSMTGVDTAHNLDITGAGIRVGVIDSGIDYHHPDLGNGCFGDFGNPNCRVLFGKDFVGDGYDAVNNPVVIPDGDPDDCGGHGTHVAGIVGARGSITGVAPDVILGGYRVFGCSGSTTGDIMLAAMEQALMDGMQVINMSIGSAFTWPDYPTAVAANNLVEKGVVVVTSIGNSGASGRYAVGAPGVGEHVIGTASIDNLTITQPSFTVSPDNTAIGYSRATGAPVPPLSGSGPLARTGTTTTANDACNALAPGSLTGKIALIRRGTCSFFIKSTNAMNAGAAAVVLYNNVAGALSPTVAGNPPITIPVVAISDVSGALIDGRIQAGPTTLTWTATGITSAVPTANQSSDFSSWGFPPDLSLKPDIAAPGGFIYSTYPVELGSFVSQSGTSMASPHTAGIVALLLQNRPTLAPNEVRGLLQNYADPRLNGTLTTMLDTPLRQGAGIVRVDRALDATVTVSPAKIALGESEVGKVTKALTIHNDGPMPVTYDLSHVAAVSTTGTTPIPTPSATGAAIVQFTTTTTVTIAAGASEVVNVEISADPSLPEGSFYSGYIVLTPQGGPSTATMRVPYAGFKGDYQSIQVLLPTTNNFPWLAKRTGQTTYANQPMGATFTMQGLDIPYFAAHLAHPASKLKVEVYNATKTKKYGWFVDQTNTSRNSTSVAGATVTYNFSTFGWTGSVVSGKNVVALPNGTYVFEVSVLKALGTESNPAHWEKWTSPPFRVARPY